MADCSVCQGGYSPSLSKTCTRCSHSRRQWFVAVAIIGGIVIVCAAVISSAYLVSTNFEEEETTCFSNRICRRVPVQAFKSVVVVWQILTQASPAIVFPLPAMIVVDVATIKGGETPVQISDLTHCVDIQAQRLCPALEDRNILRSRLAYTMRSSV